MTGFYGQGSVCRSMFYFRTWHSVTLVEPDA